MCLPLTPSLCEQKVKCEFCSRWWGKTAWWFCEGFDEGELCQAKSRTQPKARMCLCVCVWLTPQNNQTWFRVCHILLSPHSALAGGIHVCMTLTRPLCVSSFPKSVSVIFFYLLPSFLQIHKLHSLAGWFFTGSQKLTSNRQLCYCFWTSFQKFQSIMTLI